MAAMIMQVIVMWLFLSCADCTHFRGAHFWWTSSVMDPKQINISFRIAWRRTYRDSTYCNATTLLSERLMGPPDAGQIFCVSGCEREIPIGDVMYYCTDYSEVENWAAGERTFTYTFPQTRVYKLRWSGKGWVEDLQQGEDAPWEFLMDVDLTPRPDTRRPNSSPYAAMTTIVSLQQGCNHTIVIPTEDPDGDAVRCRWAEQYSGECGGICGHDPDMALNPSRCELTFPSIPRLGWYALAIQLEDFAPIDPRTPLSSVPLQFLIQVYRSGAACDEGPVFIAPTPASQGCVPLQLRQPAFFLIVVRTKDRETSLLEVFTTRTNGMKKTPVRHYHPDSRDYYVNITWTPTNVQDQIFCFAAVDSAMISTAQRCVYLSVGLRFPMALSARMSTDRRAIVVNFNQQVFRQSQSRYAWVYNQRNNVHVFLLDTSKPENVIVMNSTLTLFIPRENVFTDDVYVLLEKGVVRGRSRCSESVAVTDPSILPLNTGFVPTTGVIPTTGPTMNPYPVVDVYHKDYTWLIVLVVGTALVVGIAVLIAAFIKKRTDAKTHAQETSADQAPRPLAPRRGPVRHIDFSDIDVKFR